MSDKTEAIELKIAIPSIAAAVREHCAGFSLNDRIVFAMRYVIKRRRELFWLRYHGKDDEIHWKAAVTAVMMESPPEDIALIERSLQPIKLLAAACSGIPVDFSQLDTDGILPLIKMFQDALEQTP